MERKTSTMLRVELCSGATNDLFGGRGEGRALAVGAVGGHGVERVGDGEDACAEGNLLAAQARG